MRKKFSLTFSEVEAPISLPITKFGGQPVWISEPQWPLSRTHGTPMQFICQIELYPELFGPLAARMAYVFMSVDPGEGLFPPTFDPESGENAVVLQPGAFAEPTLPSHEGPTLYRFVPDESGGLRNEIPCEFAVDLKPGFDPDTFDFSTPDPHDKDARHAAHARYWQALTEDKIGGTPIPPGRLNTFPYPAGGPWNLLLQLNENDDRFIVNFGTDGVGYALLSADGMQARFLWARP